jgi:DNA-binding SARP family transcriptional activator
MVPLLKLAAEKRIAPDLIARALDLLDRGAAAEVREALAAPERAAAQAGAATAQLPSVRISVLGGFAIEVNGLAVETGLSARSRTREILSYLAVFPEGRRREEITTDLWPEAEAGQDKTLIMVTLHRLRRALFPELVIAPENEPYRLNPAVPFEVDARRFEERLNAARATDITDDTRRALLAEGVEAYRGPFLPSLYSDWAEYVRRRLEREYVGALAQLVRLEWEAGQYRRCLDWCQRLLATEPEQEAIHARVVECYERLGEPLAAALHRRRRGAGTEPKAGDAVEV